ncbi:MAG: radical SAM protein [Desulfovibrionaceae bacterium]|nr:radical SAM protein [Desulfovibrionaceae bacterium]
METAKHPCFSDEARCAHGRIHLPVAKDCNIACIYCNRAYDCLNESRPGVTSRILSPEEACACLDMALARVPNLSVVGIAGPGDPLANPESTLATFALVKERYPKLLLCLSTNGLALPEYAADLCAVGIGHVTVTVNAVHPDVGKHIYSWVRDKNVRHTGKVAAALLLDRQRDGIARLRKRGIRIKINTVLMRENVEHAPLIAREVASWGVQRMNCIPLIPVPGTKKAKEKPPASADLERVRKACEIHVPQMRTCTRCRADAVGLLDASRPLETVLQSQAQVRLCPDIS